MIQVERECLILSCASKRRVQPGQSACAIEMWASPFHDVVRKWHPNNLDVFVISSKHGLLRASDVIEWYDHDQPITRDLTWVREFVLRKWYTFTDSDPCRYTTIWHNVLMDAQSVYIACLSRFGELKYVTDFVSPHIPSNVKMAIGVRIGAVRALCRHKLLTEQEGSGTTVSEPRRSVHHSTRNHLGDS